MERTDYAVVGFLLFSVDPVKNFFVCVGSDYGFVGKFVGTVKPKSTCDYSFLFNSLIRFMHVL